MCPFFRIIVRQRSLLILNSVWPAKSGKNWGLLEVVIVFFFNFFQFQLCKQIKALGQAFWEKQFNNVQSQYLLIVTCFIIFSFRFPKKTWHWLSIYQVFSDSVLQTRSPSSHGEIGSNCEWMLIIILNVLTRNWAEFVPSVYQEWGCNLTETILGSLDFKIRTSKLISTFFAGLHSSVFTCGKCG